MGRFPLLPGEHEELRLRPAPAGWVGAYLLALVPAAAGAVLWVLARLPTWRNDAAGNADWMFWDHLWGDDQALAFYAVAAIVLGSLLHFAIRRRARALLVGTVALLLLVAGAAIFRSVQAPTSVALPILVAGLSLVALAWVEARRRTTEYVFTNLRMLVRRTMPRSREAGSRYQDLVDLRAKAGLGDAGTLIPVLTQAAATAPPPVFPGVRPFARVRPFVELLVQRATAGDYLRASERLEQRIAEARAGLQRRA